MCKYSLTQIFCKKNPATDQVAGFVVYTAAAADAPSAGTRDLQTGAGITHALRVHILAFEDVQVHLTKAVGKHYPYQLRILETVIFLCKIQALTVLVRHAGTEDICHADRHRGRIILQEAFFNGQVEPVRRFYIPLRRALGVRTGRTKRIIIQVHRQIGLRLVDSCQLHGKILWQLEIAVELAKPAPQSVLRRLVQVLGIDMGLVYVQVRGDIPPLGEVVCGGKLGPHGVRVISILIGIDQHLLAQRVKTAVLVMSDQVRCVLVIRRDQQGIIPFKGLHIGELE
jgi:hypothetical protein